MLTPTMTKFVKWCQETTKPIIADRITEATEELSSVRGLIYNIHHKQQKFLYFYFITIPSGVDRKLMLSWIYTHKIEMH